MNYLVKNLALLCIIAASFSCSQPESIIDNKQLFDFDWKFQLGDFPEATSSTFDDSQWQELNLPHDWSIAWPIDPNNPSGNDGGYFPNGTGWYRKSFKVPADWNNKQISVYFEGVYTNSEVFVNGHSLGTRPYGYSSFMYNLSPYLEFGKENILSVRVDNSQQKNSRWYSGSGIYRHVWLLVNNNVFLQPWGIGITTPEVSAESALVQLNAKLENKTDTDQNLVVLTKIKDRHGELVQSKEISVSIEAGLTKEFVQELEVGDPELWSPDSPALYHAEFDVLQSGQLVDHREQEFGIRSIEFTSENGFLLNGKPLLMNGGCVHHDNGCLGAAAYDRAEERKVELLKKAGFNAVRTSHNPPSEAFLTACDRLGLLVIDEAFDGWRTAKTTYDYAMHFDEWAQNDVQTMVLRDRNHPSIIMWSIGNEVIERKSPEAVETARMLRNAIRAIDTTRPVTSAMTTWDGDWDVFDPLMAEHDICGYNYQLFRAPADHIRVPERIIVNTESYPANAFNIWKLASENTYILGDFVWTAIDYLGEAGIGAWYYPGEQAAEHWQGPRYPWHGAYCGDIDLTGWRKPISHYRSMLYNDDEKLYMAVREPNPEDGKIRVTGWAVWPTWESWTWPGHEGKDIQVEVYSKYPKVQLYLNDELIGEKLTGKAEEFKATFTLPYKPGVLKALAISDETAMDTVMLRSAGAEQQIKLQADRSEIYADAQDLSYVFVSIVDANGTIQHDAEPLLSFSLNGPGKIIGVDNAYLKDNSSYTANERKAWKGRAMVVIQSTKQAGEIQLTVSSPDLGDEVINIESHKRL